MKQGSRNAVSTARIFVSLACVFAFSFFFSTDTHSKKPGEDGMKKQQLILIINYPYQIWSNDPTKIHLTLFKPDFIPARGAKVVVNGKSVGKADKNGVCIFDYIPGSNQSHNLVATLKEKKKTYEVIKDFSSYSRTVSFKADRVYVYTDRGVYNPGQNILVRIMAWQLKGEYSPIADAKIQLLLQDKNGKVFSGDYVETNPFGIGATKLTLPPNMPEGDYELVTLYEKARETASIRVKRFVPPVISIKHNLKRYFTDTQDKLQAKVELGYFAGGKIKSSKLTLSFLSPDKKELFTKEYSSKKTTYTINLDSKQLDLIRKKMTLEGDYKIKLKATDNYGQTNEIVWDFTYTARPYTAVLEIDKDAYPKGEKVQILAKVVDIDKQPAKDIPLILEIPEIELIKETRTDDKGVAVLEFIMPENTVTAYVKSPIMKDVLAQRTIPYQTLKPMVSKASEPPKGAGTKTTIKVNFDPNYIPIEKIVHIDMTDVSGALVVSTTIPIHKNANRYVAAGKVTAPTWGSMLVNLYCCAIEKKSKAKPLTPNIVGFITEGQHITFYPDKELEITVSNFKPTAAPGDKVSFKVKVKGGKGEKCLGVSVVDDAVLSLLDPFIKDPIQHFYNPQVKVISTGGAGVLTWPVVDRNWGSPWRDIAYCNWGWKSPGPFIAGAYRKLAETEAGLAADQEIDGSYYDDISGEPMNGEEEKEMVKKSVSQPAAEPAMTKTASLPGKGKRDGEGEKPEKPSKKIIIRTHFPETALWEPLLVTKNGKSEFTVRMPDEITRQKLSIVATDKKGYIGFLRKGINVTQPIFVRAAFPATMTLGDEIKVHALIRNLTNKKIKCTAYLSGDKLDVKFGKNIPLTIPKNETAMAEWIIKATHCGLNNFKVSCETADFVDSEKKSIYVLPAGIPQKQLVKGNIEKGKTWKAVFTADRDATYRVVNLNVTMPNVFPAIQAWWAFDVFPAYSPWESGASAIMNAAMLDYAKQSKGNKKYITLIEQKLNSAAAQLTYQQFPSGAWGWYFLADATAPNAVPVVGGENLYYTIYCLHALAEIKKAGLPVDDNVISRAVDYILKAQNKDGLWSSKRAYFWEIFNDQTDNAMSAEAFEVLMLTASVFPSLNNYDEDFLNLKDKMVGLLKSHPQEPMTVAATVQGLLYWSKYKKDTSVDKLLKKNIDYLITLKRTGYWEPHWYHAYGGMVELNARILELLAEFDSEKYTSYLREGMTYLLSTREAWGAWHNEIGTATAIRALLKTGAFAKEKKSEISLNVNGKQITKIEIDPKDPFLSAAKLRYFEITPWIKSGKNNVEVKYNGNLTASVSLELKQWGVKQLKTKEIVAIERVAPEKAEVGEPVTVKLRLNAQKEISVMTIEEHIPAVCDIDISSLEKLKKAQKITGYTVDDGKLYLVLVSVKGKLNIEYKLKTKTEGTGLHAGTSVIDATSGELLASIISHALTVN